MKDKHTMGSPATSVESLSQASLYESIRTLLLASRTQVRQTVNTAMVQTYWHIGRMIVEDEQGGQKRAAHGKQVLPALAKRLTQEFGSGFSAPSLWNYRQFYQCFPILSAVRRELTWTHYKTLLRIENLTAREWYAQEAAHNINIEAAPPTKRQPDARLDFVLRAQCGRGQVFVAGRQGPVVCQQIPSADAYRSGVASRVRARPGFVGNT
jgi:hypothetical protein